MFLAASWVRYWAKSLQPKTYLFTNSLKNNFAFILLSVLRLAIFACVSSERKIIFYFNSWLSFQRLCRLLRG